jgi:hypothetical protein
LLRISEVKARDRGVANKKTHVFQIVVDRQRRSAPIDWPGCDKFRPGGFAACAGSRRRKNRSNRAASAAPQNDGRQPFARCPMAKI